MKSTPDKPGSEALRKGRRSAEGAYYYLTKNSATRGSEDLVFKGAPEIIIDSLFWAMNEGLWKLLGFVVMPDHYHALIHIGNRKNLSGIMESLGKYSAQKINRMRKVTGRFWQDGFHDHRIRPHEDLNHFLDYMHLNPVRAKLVENPEEWPYSSVHEEYGKKVSWD
ncbi:MAG: REP-associated tyrosine transposase [Planctomycetota bacterium]|jgi:REP element-mobilizing transposase RayT